MGVAVATRENVFVWPEKPIYFEILVLYVEKSGGESLLGLYM